MKLYFGNVHIARTAYFVTERPSSSTVELVDRTCDGRRVVAVYCTSVDLNALAPLLEGICYTTYSCKCAAVDEISTDRASAVTELLVQ